MVVPFLAAFQLVAGAPGVYNGRAGETRVSIPKMGAAGSIDGNLHEPAWQNAPPLTGFSLYTPVDKRPAPDSTEVRVWYSVDAMYFGLRAFAPAGTVAATLADRDRISADDNI